MDFLELAKKRFSARKFSDKLISKNDFEKILQAGQIAPTAKNLQPQRIYVLQSNSALEKIASLTPCTFNAKTVLIFTYNEDEEWKNQLQEGIHSGVEDVSIVATHIMLEATDLGIDSIWVNRFANAEVEKAFNIPSNEKVVLLMPLGYKTEDCVPGPNHSINKKIDDFVKYL
ncbi:MAG: nitroreductase [Treponema sp.]|nr:nitroreductase [Treponema sp.]